MELYVSARGCLVVALLMLVLTVSPSHCFETGAPIGSCGSMRPGHGYANGGATSYVVEVLGGATKYQAGTNIKVRIGGGTYKGLLLQARVQGTTTIVGSFMAPAVSTNTKTINCGTANSAITHSSTYSKTQAVEFTWQPPAGNVGVVEFVATVNQAKTVWWLNRKSTALSYGGSATAVTTTTARATSPSTTTIPASSSTTTVSVLLMVVAAFTARML